MKDREGPATYALALALLIGVLGSVAAGCDVRGGAGTHLDGLGSSLAEIQKRARAEGSLDLVASPGYADSSWTEPFARQTGCRVVVDEVASSDAMWSELDMLDWDAVPASGAEGGRLVREGRVAPLDTALLPNYEELARVPGGWLREPDGEPYGMPFGRTPNLLLYLTDAFPEETDSWSALWEQGRRLGRSVSLPDDPLVIADAAVYLKATRPDLRIDDPYELDERQFEAAVRLVRRLEPDLVSRAFEPATRVQQLVSGETVVGMTSPAEVELAIGSGARVRAVKPVEGTTGRSDTWMVSRSAPHPNCAYAWLDYSGSPAVQAMAAERLRQAPVNLAACELTRNPEHCTELHATDDAWWDDVYFWTTPLADCGDDRGKACATEEEWTAAWSSLRRRG